MEDQNSQEESASGNVTSRSIFREFQDLYSDQLKDTDESWDGLKLKVKILENWVHDLTDQNEMLVKTVDDLEGEALKRLSMLEANLPQRNEVTPGFTPQQISTPRGLKNVESLSQELMVVKQQLSDKEKLISKCQSRIEELRKSVKNEKFDSSKAYVHQYAMTENVCTSKLEPEQRSVHKELETTQVQLCQMEHEVTQLKKKLKEAESSIKRLRSDLVGSEKNAREMRSALTAEVAEKHDQILALRREVATLEDQLRQADMQTHFKDDIIKELRKEVKVARSKETLVEVLGIKERSLSHMEHLTEQLEQKDHTISCLRAQLQQHKEHKPDTLYRMRQQVDWFTENVSLQCAQGNVPEEFKKCITTMLEELRESIECCNFGPTNSTEPHKDSVEILSALQKSLDQAQTNLSQSWSSIWDTAHKINKIELSQLVEEWKKCLSKQQYLQQKIQELIRSVINVISKSKTLTGTITDSIDALYYTLDNFGKELTVQPQGKSYSNWVKKLHSSFSESIYRIEEVYHIAADIRDSDQTILGELGAKLEAVDSLEWELNEIIATEQKAYEKLHNLERAQRVHLDTLLATVLHHNSLWSQQMSLSDDMKKEMISLIGHFKMKKNQSQKKSDKKLQNPVERHSLQVKSLVTKISTGIRGSMSDIEYRQNQVNQLEVDLSSVKVVLDSAQHEIERISKESNSREDKKIRFFLDKLKKEIMNALKKAECLVEIYKTSRKDYMSSSQRVLALQKEFGLLEEELVSFQNLICQFPDKTDSPIQKNNLQAQFKEMQRALIEKDAAVKQMKENLSELKTNLMNRDKMRDNQNETINILQNSLKMCQKEAEELHKTVVCLESTKTEIEQNCKKQIHRFQNKISDLESCLKQSEDTAKKHQRSEAALQIVIATLKENLNKEQQRCAGLLKEKKKLEEQCMSISSTYKMELENNNKREAVSSQENQIIIAELKKQVKCWSMKVAELEEQLKDIQVKLCESTCLERDLQEQLATKDTECKADLCEKQKEINKLSGIVKSMTEKLKEATAEGEVERVKHCETEQKLQAIYTAFDELKVKSMEKESHNEKLQVALTQLSTKFVSRRLDSTSCVRHYQEECAKFEALYNATACKLHSKEIEMSSMVMEIDRLRTELDNVTATPLHQKEDESCPFLLGRVQQLSKELQIAHSCKNSYETIIKDLTEKCTKKEEEVSYLKSQLKQATFQRDTLLLDLEGSQEEITRLKMNCSDLKSALRKTEISKAQITEQMKSVQRMLCDSQTSTQSALQPNIELQREISTTLSNQLRGTKQKLHATSHDYKLLQTAYKELHHKYSMLQEGERDLEPQERQHHKQQSQTHCTPCVAKSSKSAAHVKYSQEGRDKDLSKNHSSNSKSWHKLETSHDLEQREKRWKQKLQEVIRGEDFEASDFMNNSSSSN